jgi:hypothetical protein
MGISSRNEAKPTRDAPIRLGLAAAENAETPVKIRFRVSDIDNGPSFG